jgi:hypothetical protein
MKLRTNSDAPTISTSDSATSTTTSVPRTRLPRPPVPEPRAPSFSEATRLVRVACAAGTSPNTIPVRPATVIVYATTRQSISMTM